MKFAKNTGKFLAWFFSHAVEAMATGLCAVAALGSLYLADGMAAKLAAFAGFILLGFVIAWLMGKVRGEDKE